MTDELYLKATIDYLQVAVIMALAEQAKGNPITLELVLNKAAEAKDLLQTQSAMSAITTRNIPEGVLGTYRAMIGEVHDRGAELFAVALALP
jgi:hypothetical protein